MNKYILTNGKQYLNNRMRLTDKVDKAVKLNSMEAAKNVLKSLPIESKKFNWNIKKYVEPTCDDSNNNSIDIKVDTEIVRSNQPNKDILGINEFAHTYVDIDELKSDIKSISNKISSMKNNKEYLLQELSNVDMAICDVMHYIEFNNFNACVGYKLCKVLKDLRLYRRKIKDELNIINLFETQTCDHLAKGNTYDSLNNYANRKYAARVFGELFDGNTGNSSSNIGNVLTDVIDKVKNYITQKTN